MDEYDVVWSRESIYDAADITDELLTTIEAEDIPETKHNDVSSKIRIGFACKKASPI